MRRTNIEYSESDTVLQHKLKCLSEMGYTNTEIGHLVGLSNSTVRYYLLGKSSLTSAGCRIKNAFASYFGCDWTELQKPFIAEKQIPKEIAFINESNKDVQRFEQIRQDTQFILSGEPYILLKGTSVDDVLGLLDEIKNRLSGGAEKR